MSIVPKKPQCSQRYKVINQLETKKTEEGSTYLWITTLIGTCIMQHIVRQFVTDADLSCYVADMLQHSAPSSCPELREMIGDLLLRYDDNSSGLHVCHVVVIEAG